MSQARLANTLPPDTRILLDASALIAYLDGRDAVSPVITHLIDDFVQSGRNPAIVPMVAVTEILVRPLRSGVTTGYAHTLDFLARFPNLRTANIDLAVAQEAASVRAVHRLPTPDALTIASGLVHQVGFLVTNDRAWKVRLDGISSRIGVLLLSEFLPFT